MSVKTFDEKLSAALVDAPFDMLNKRALCGMTGMYI